MATTPGCTRFLLKKQGAYDAMMKDYYSRVSPIQDKLNAKGIELDALSLQPQRQARDHFQARQ